MRTNRRDVLRLLGAAGLASLLPASLPRARASGLLRASSESAPPRYLIVLTASGGMFSMLLKHLLLEHILKF